MRVLPFDDSRRLTGGNLFFPGTGAVLDAVGVTLDDGLIGAWRTRVERAAAHLGWKSTLAVARRHAGGVGLAITAPVDQLLLATEVNEWALCASLVEHDPQQWSGLEPALQAAAFENSEDDPAQLSMPPVIERSAAFARFDRLAALESRPRLSALVAAARAHDLSYALDDTTLTLGSGDGGEDFLLDALPDPEAVPWSGLHDVPTAVVTGSNGKTTTVRLLAACTRARGWRTAYNCTDGVFFDTETLATGDYSGPAGTRTVLRERRAQAAILETARGGILRRGLAVTGAAVAVITNVSADHFGEYGIDDIEGLAAVKFAVAGVVRATGLLVLNADDPVLRAAADRLAGRFGHSLPLGWFCERESAELDSLFRAGASTCGPRDGRLLLHHRGSIHDLGPIAAMPLSMRGVAVYNVANMAGAALAAVGLGIAPTTIAGVLAQFGAVPTDNPGRLMRFERGGVRVIVDYAHNPDGLQGFLEVAASLRGDGRLALLLGQAGNRSDADMQELATVAFRYRPDLVVVKENETQLRGRAPGETPQLLYDALRHAGMADSNLMLAHSELEAAHRALDWARPGDVLAMPIHSAAARAAVLALLAPD